MDSQFDESGDSLIAQMDSQPIEMIEPSLKWPHLLKHPKFYWLLHSNHITK